MATAASVTWTVCATAAPWGLAMAQTIPPTQATSQTAGLAARAPLPDGKAPPASAANQLIEKIQIDDADVRVDESRFGGETRTITVTPKGGFPAYDVRPSTGRSTWKILGF